MIGHDVQTFYDYCVGNGAGAGSSIGGGAGALIPVVRSAARSGISTGLAGVLSVSAGKTSAAGTLGLVTSVAGASDGGMLGSAIASTGVAVAVVSSSAAGSVDGVHATSDRPVMSNAMQMMVEFACESTLNRT